MSIDSPLLLVRGLTVQYPQARAGKLLAVDRVSFELEAGRTLGIVGESGCGKSSLARAILQLEEHDGEVVLQGERLETLSARDLRRARGRVQTVFQDPMASLNPRRRVFDLVAEPLEIHRPGISRDDCYATVRNMLDRVGIDASLHRRYPHELSGGQCQRVAIARAVVCEPALLICDEPVSALDMSVRGQILSLLATLQRDLGIAMIFIAHDMSAVRYLCETVLVMLAGEMVEVAPRQSLFERPAHPYTRQLLRAVLPPDPDKQPASMRGSSSDALATEGCVFAPRCPHVEQSCREHLPRLQVLDDHQVACRRAGEI